MPCCHNRRHIVQLVIDLMEDTALCPWTCTFHHHHQRFCSRVLVQISPDSYTLSPSQCLKHPIDNITRPFLCRSSRSDCPVAFVPAALRSCALLAALLVLSASISTYFNAIPSLLPAVHSLVSSSVSCLTAETAARGWHRHGSCERITGTLHTPSSHV